jgi:hypothetical protein
VEGKDLRFHRTDFLVGRDKDEQEISLAAKFLSVVLRTRGTTHKTNENGRGMGWSHLKL